MFGLKPLWGNTSQQPQQVPQQPQQQTQPQQQPAQQQQAPAAPNYAALWTAQPAQQATLKSPLTVNQQELMTLAKGKQFGNIAVPPEAVQALVNGDATLFNQFLGTFARVMYAHTMMDAMQATSGAFDAYGNQVEQYLPNAMQNFQLTNDLSKSNPLMKDPAYAPMVEAIARQMRATNPQASPQEVQSMVEGYFNKMAADMGYQKPAEPTPQQVQQQQQQQQMDTDWSAFGGFEMPGITAPVATSQPTVSATPAGPVF